MAKAKVKTEAKKKRVYEIAREFNLSSVAMVEQIRSLGFEVKNHMAVCTTAMVEAVQEKFDSERQATRRKLRRKDDERKEREIQEKKPRVSQPRSVRPDAKPETRSENRQRPRRRRRRTDYPTVVVEDVSQTPVQVPETKAPEKKKEKPEVQAAAKPKEKPVQEEKSRTRSPRKRRRRRKRPVVDEREVSANVRRTLAQMSSGASPSRVRRRRRQDSETPEDETTDGQVLKVNEFTTVGELSSQMDVRPTEVITQCLKLGMVVTINQRLDMDTITLVADEFGFDIEQLEEYGEEVLEAAAEVEVSKDTLKPRPPVVTIMGHVDHGKTSLLDYIRETNVMEGEAGGITQHIGAYHVELSNGREICFLDTPGHEAFTAMRARGASVTDVVVLVVAADDSVMPQTVEAIDHAKAANVPLVIAINKIDLPTADSAKIKRELTEHNVVVEDYGGNVQVCEISAKTGHNVDALLELLALETEMLELMANPDKRAKGTIVESKLDRGRGNIATVLVQEGRLQIGDPFITGMFSGRVRAMLDERGLSVATAGPSRPVQVLGLAGLPQAGDTFHVVENEREARDISQKRQQLRREQEFHRVRRVSLTDIHNQIETGNIEELRLIIKGDVDGSVEALQDALLQIEHEEVRLSVIHRAVGAVSESDILLASASDAIIIGFNVRPDANAREVAARERVDIRLYRVIYEVVEDIRAALSGLLAPKIEESVQGEAQVRELFPVPRIGTIAGCLVSQGLIHRTTNARVLRDGVVIYEGRIGSLRRFKDDVREVQNGFECGISIENFNDVKVGDVIETYELIETTRTI